MERITARSYESIGVGLRRVIRDPNVKVKDRLGAIRLIMHVEGLMEAGKTPRKPALDANSEVNNQAIRDLLELAQNSRSPETSEVLRGY